MLNLQRKAERTVFLWVDLIPAYHYLIGRCRGDETRLSSEVQKDQRQKIKVDKWEIQTRHRKKKKKTIKAVEHRNKLLRGVKESPHPKILKTWLHKTLINVL